MFFLFGKCSISVLWYVPSRSSPPEARVARGKLNFFFFARSSVRCRLIVFFIKRYEIFYWFKLHARCEETRPITYSKAKQSTIGHSGNPMTHNTENIIEPNRQDTQLEHRKQSAIYYLIRRWSKNSHLFNVIIRNLEESSEEQANNNAKNVLIC